MPRLKKEKIRAILFHAIAKFVGSEADRDQLAGGESHKLQFSLAGQVGNQKLEAELVDGKLIVNHDTQRASSVAVKPAKVIAFLLGMEKQPEKRIQQLQALAKDGTLDDAVTADQVTQAESLLKLFNQKGASSTSRGSVRFEPAKMAA